MPPYSRRETRRLEHLHDARSPPQAQISRNSLESGIFLVVEDRRGPDPADRWSSKASFARHDRSSASLLRFQSAEVTSQSFSHLTRRHAGLPAWAWDSPNSANRESKRSRCDDRVVSVDD